MALSRYYVNLLAVLFLFFGCKVAQGQQFVTVEATVFERGAEVAANVFEAGRAPHYGPDWDEGPRHKVRVSAFRIGIKQVAMDEFARFMPQYEKRIESAGVTWSGKSPAVLVSWNEANDYCKWVAEKTGENCRLPTETEWELAASQKVKLKLVGIADGVQEWCFDWWAPYPKQLDQIADPCGPVSGIVKVHRDGGGGSVEEKKDENEEVTDFRITDRSATVADDRRPGLGFRVVIGSQPKHQNGNVETAPPFENVSDKASDWNSSRQDAPFFWAGGKFIDSASNAFPDIAYWNRHHVPSLTWCDNGDLLATAFTAAFDNSDQMAILITRLKAGHKKWEAPARFFVAPDHNVTSALLFNAGDGQIHHYNGIGNHRCEDFSMIKRVSRDNGVSWSEAKIVHRFPTDAASPDNPYGKPRLWPHMDLKSFEVDGQRVLLMSTDVGPGNELGSAAFVSRNNGDSWKELTRTGWHAESFARKGESSGWIAGIHAPIEKLADGSLLAFGRSNNIDGFAPLSRSVDFGKTWTYSASPFPPILSGQRSVLMRLREGPLLFVSFTDSSVSVREKKAVGMKFRDSGGDLHTGFGMFAAISSDEGKTWTNRKLIPNWIKKPWRSRYSGYLSCVQTPDGQIHLVSSSHYYRFNLAWLQEPMGNP